jgi:hypothetical protein
VHIDTRINTQTHPYILPWKHVVNRSAYKQAYPSLHYTRKASSSSTTSTRADPQPHRENVYAWRPRKTTRKARQRNKSPLQWTVRIKMIDGLICVFYVYVTSFSIHLLFRQLDCILAIRVKDQSESCLISFPKMSISNTRLSEYRDWIVWMKSLFVITDEFSFNGAFCNDFASFTAIFSLCH